MEYLQRGSVAHMLSCPDAHPVAPHMLQILGHKPTTGRRGEERFHLEVSDGLHSTFMALASRGNENLKNGELKPFTVVKVRDFKPVPVYNNNNTSTNNSEIELRTLNIVKPGVDVGAVIGNPVPYTKENARLAKFQRFSLKPGSILSKMHSSEVGKDLKIVTSTRAEFKCHKAIVAANCPSLIAMMTSEETEPGTVIGRIQVNDLSEEGINLFLRYLYGMEVLISKETMTCDFALDLMKASKMYELVELEKELQKFFLEENFRSGWFTADCLLELHDFSKDSNSEGLKMHSLQIMTRMHEDLYKCGSFQKLDSNETNKLLMSLLAVAVQRSRAPPPTSDRKPRIAQMKNSSLVLREMFRCELSKDLSIVASNGGEMKCHKSIFAAQSPVLAVLVSSEMKESITGRVEFKQLTEEALEHLLPFFYGMELQIGALSCEVALQLFEFAEMYELLELKMALKKLFLNENSKSGWYTADALLDLYAVTKSLDHFENLKKHCLNLMSTIYGAVKQCERYKKLDAEGEAGDFNSAIIDYLRNVIDEERMQHSHGQYSYYDDDGYSINSIGFD